METKMIQYGLISKVDADCIEKTLDLILSEFKGIEINTCQIGVFDGQTDRGIHEYVLDKGRSNNHTAIDNEKDKPILLPFSTCNLIIGNSNEVYNQIEDNSQHLIFVDGGHAFPTVVADFFCYESKVKRGGYFAFHDSGSHIKANKDYQRMGSELDPDMYISVRKALTKIGVLNDELYGWRLIFDEADPSDEAGGIVVLKKYGNV